MKKNKYVFYFDETYHDRKITIKDDSFNTMNSNSFDCYIGVFWGCEQNELYSIISLLTNFEKKYKNKFGLSDDQELKSDIVKKKNYINGLTSFNKNAADFYSELFLLLEHINPIIQIDAISKVEIFLIRLFENINLECFGTVNRNNFIYSLTKLILNYQDSSVINSIKNVCDDVTAEDFRIQLMKFIREKINEFKGIGRKEGEVEILNEFLLILNNITFDNMKYDELRYPYKTNYIGLSYLLNELDIPNNNVKIVVDEELDTYNSFNESNFKKVKQANSKNSIQIRLCDWLCGFIGRMSYALINDIGAKELNGENIVQKRLLSEKWFDFDETVFLLYKRINKFFNVDHSHYWTIMTKHYADPIVEFCTLLRYIGSYGSYKDFSSREIIDHQEYFNSACIDELFNRFSM